MKTLKNLVLFIGLSCMAIISHAHNPQLATFYIRNYDAVWMIEGSFSQAGLQTAMGKYFPNVDFQNISSEKYNKLVTDYVKSHITIKTEDGQLIKLGEGGLRMGSHQSDVRFILENLPQNPENLSFMISCLSENHHQQNILKIPALKPGEHFILSEKNDFTTEIIFIEKPKTLANMSIGAKTSEFFLVILLAGFTVGIYYAFKRINTVYKSKALPPLN